MDSTNSNILLLQQETLYRKVIKKNIVRKSQNIEIEEFIDSEYILRTDFDVETGFVVEAYCVANGKVYFVFADTEIRHLLFFNALELHCKIISFQQSASDLSFEIEVFQVPVNSNALCSMLGLTLAEATVPFHSKQSDISSSPRAGYVAVFDAECETLILNKIKSDKTYNVHCPALYHFLQENKFVKCFSLGLMYANHGVLKLLLAIEGVEAKDLESNKYGKINKILPLIDDAYPTLKHFPDFDAEVEKVNESIECRDWNHPDLGFRYNGVQSDLDKGYLVFHDDLVDSVIIPPDWYLEAHKDDKIYELTEDIISKADTYNDGVIFDPYNPNIISDIKTFAYIRRNILPFDFSINSIADDEEFAEAVAAEWKRIRSLPVSPKQIRETAMFANPDEHTEDGSDGVGYDVSLACFMDRLDIESIDEAGKMFEKIYNECNTEETFSKYLRDNLIPYSTFKLYKDKEKQEKYRVPFMSVGLF